MKHIAFSNGKLGCASGDPYITTTPLSFLRDTVISMIDTGVTMIDSMDEIMNTTDTETITDNTTGM